MRELWDLIIQSAQKGIKLQLKNGSFPPGHNGPRHDVETPVRNTSHWLITLLKAYEYSGNILFKKSAEKASEYLLSRAARPMNYTFWCRKNSKKDFCNGLIGQAWVIEALVLAFTHFCRHKYADTAKEVFLLHPFDERLGLWHAVNIDGTVLPIHTTFNQQLWFAVSGILMLNNKIYDERIEFRVKKFLENLEENIHIHINGLIGHLILDVPGYKNLNSRIKHIIKSLKLMLSKEYYEQSIGYHSFNLYGFAILKKEGWLTNYFWRGRKFKKALQYAATKEFERSIESNRYTFQYNPVGFEIAFVIEAFPERKEISSLSPVDWVNRQIKRHYSFKESLMCKNTSDIAVLSARIYEAARLSNLEIRAF